ncbi:MAG: hypothetical protein HY736_17045, partial [Verrucomicrobia bacterium]|nr:hypothetical protein [Verrucomicrobiota bacterium]
PLRQVIPSRHADGQMWVRHALAARESHQARVRFTVSDNALIGREVHWSSAFPWMIRAAGSLHQAMTGAAGSLALERALFWFNAPLLFGLVVLFSSWAGRQAGAGAGLLVALGMVGHKRFYEGFTPTYIDHHGVVTAAVFGLVLGIAFMGAGWWKPAAGEATSLLPSSRERARNAAIFSAASGAVGMWFSAAAVLPGIAMVGAAGLAVAWWQGRAARREGAIFEPGLWRLWGRVGAGASFVFYLLEYAPAHFSLRLEVNHPLYSLAWWGGAEIVAIVAAWRLESAEPFRRAAGRLTLPVLAVAAPPLAMLAGGSAAFALGDPFVGELRHFVAEGRSLLASARQSGFPAVAYDLASVLILVPARILLLRRRDETRIVLGFLTAVTAAWVAMAFFEMRWWLAGSGPQIGLLLCLIAVGASARPRARWLVIGAATAMLLLPAGVMRIVTARAENRDRVVSEGDLLQPLYRDIAATLRETQPEGDIVLLASPNASMGISYYGRFKSLGTLFWENADGLRAAARIFSAGSDEDAAALVRARGVTHLAILSTANFVGEYFRLLHPDAEPERAKETFGYRLLAKQALPPWLQPVPYRRPAGLEGATRSVALFKVAFDQTDVERLYHVAFAQLADGEVALAEQTFALALARVPASARLSFCESAGAAFYHYGADAAAVRIFRQGLEYGQNPVVANLLAWILATTSDAALRDGRAALALVEAKVRNEPDDPTVLSTFAAACAEVGRFAEAVSAAERALALVRAAGDPAAEALLQRRLDAYRAGRPWRQ